MTVAPGSTYDVKDNPQFVAEIFNVTEDGWVHGRWNGGMAFSPLTMRLEDVEGAIGAGQWTLRTRPLRTWGA